MDPQTIALLMFAARFGLEAAITIGTRLAKPGATFDDALAAMIEIRDKGAMDYIMEARRRAVPPLI